MASGAYDVVMAVGVEKLKDSGYSGLVGNAPANDGTMATVTAPASFSLLAPAYAHKYGVDDDEMKDVLTRIAWKNHKNGALNPRAQFRKEVPKDTISCSPLVAGPLGIFDCSGVSDGRAAAIIVRAEDAARYCPNPLYVKALSFVAGPAAGPIDPTYDYTTFREVVRSAEDAYAQAGITNPRAELAMAEVHDCFTPTELVLMEDLGFAERGMAWKEVLAGTFDLDGELPVNPDGGLKSFGHPIGASGLRMLFEAWLQLRGEAPRRAPDRAASPPARPRPSPTTWVARPARASASCRSSAASWAESKPSDRTLRLARCSMLPPRLASGGHEALPAGNQCRAVCRRRPPAADLRAGVLGRQHGLRKRHVQPPRRRGARQPGHPQGAGEAHHRGAGQSRQPAGHQLPARVPVRRGARR